MKKEHFDSNLMLSFTLGFMVAIVGCGLGIFFLVKEAPKRLSPAVFAEAQMDVDNLVEEGPAPVFILPIRDRGGESFIAKRDAFISGQSPVLEFTEPEINAWLRANFTPVNDPSMNERPFVLLPSVPKLSLQEGYLQIVMDLTVLLSGDQHTGIFTAKGNFQKIGDRWAFDTKESAIASARIPGGGVVGNTFIDVFKSIFSAAPEFQEVSGVWEQVRDIELLPGLIRISK